MRSIIVNIRRLASERYFLSDENNNSVKIVSYIDSVDGIWYVSGTPAVNFGRALEFARAEYEKTLVGTAVELQEIETDIRVSLIMGDS